MRWHFKTGYNTFFGFLIMERNSTARREARMSLKGKWGGVVLATLLFLLFVLVLSSPSSLNYFIKMPLAVRLSMPLGTLLLTIFVLYPLAFGYMNSMLDLTRGVETGTVKNMFSIGFKGNYWRGIGVVLLVGIYVILWSLLLFIPGIIKGMAYSLSYFIVRDNPEIAVDDCIYLSRKLMKGHKWEMFLLQLGFALLSVLVGGITLGIGLLWMIPYLYCSYAGFYERLKEEQWQGASAYDMLQKYHGR